jgi:hypothetical protein
LAPEPLSRPLFISHAALDGLIDSESGGGGNIELAISGDTELRHIVGHGNDQLRAYDDRGDRDRHGWPPAPGWFNRIAGSAS